jgi:hypothetical protein
MTYQLSICDDRVPMFCCGAHGQEQNVDKIIFLISIFPVSSKTISLIVVSGSIKTTDLIKK